MKKINTDCSLEGVAVVITCANHANGLGVARALRKLPVKIIGITSDRQSRFCKSNVWDELYVTEAIIPLEYLIELRSRLEYEKVILIPIQDEMVTLLTNNRKVLQNKYLFVLPSKIITDTLMNKTEFHQWAVEHNFLVPSSYIVKSMPELDRVLNQVEYPIIIKPLVRSIKWDSVSPLEKAIKLNNKDEIKNYKFDLFNVASEYILQQWIPGGDNKIHFCLVYVDRNGVCLGHYTGKKIFQWPIGSGSTAACVGTKNREVYKMTEELFKKIGFVGLGSVEYKHNPLDGKYYIIEPTVGRTDLQSYVAVAGGVNLPEKAVFDALNYNPDRCNHRESKMACWMDEYMFFQVILYYLKNRNFKVFNVLKLATKRLSFSHFAINDLRPALALLSMLIYRMIRKIKI